MSTALTPAARTKARIAALAVVATEVPTSRPRFLASEHIGVVVGDEVPPLATSLRGAARCGRLQAVHGPAEGANLPTKHGLGFGNGKIIEYEDGSAGYVPTGQLTQAFRVQISDVTGFSVVRGGKMLERVFNLLGNGTLLASASVTHGTSEILEQWFRAHPLFGQRAPSAPEALAPTPTEAIAPASTALIADELRKLADLRAEGILTDDEFAVQKAHLLGR